MTPDTSPTGQDQSPGPRLVLAVETSGPEGSICLGFLPKGRLQEATRWDYLRLLGSRSLEAGEEHASLLVPRIRELLEATGTRTSELSGLVVGAGPGSFTGVRVGAATAKGMARALGIPMWAFSSLASAAFPPFDEPGSGSEPSELWGQGNGGDSAAASPSLRPCCVIFDARGDRVYAAAYRATPTGLEVLLEPRASTLDEMCEGLIPPGAYLVGSGAVRHRPVLEALGFQVLRPPLGVPTADGLLQLLALSPTTPPLADPGRWEPEYLRASGAERMRRSRRPF